jgi:hypothetical protein
MGGQEKRVRQPWLGNVTGDNFQSTTGATQSTLNGDITGDTPGQQRLANQKTWNMYSLGHCGSYLPQVQRGLPSAVYISPYSNIVPCQTGLPQQADIEGAGTKKDRRREERSEIQEEEFTIYTWVYHDGL